jgi:hypothetical protein
MIRQRQGKEKRTRAEAEVNWALACDKQQQVGPR